MSATTAAHQEGLQKTQMQSKRDEGFEPRPELLMAARSGDWQQLERLLLCNGGVHAAAAAPQPVRDVVVVDIEIEEDALTSGEAVTMAGDSVLHVVASRGDGEEFLKSATAIHGKSSRLLFATNKKGDTPLHCAARAGRGRMVTHLVALASAGNRHDGGGKKVKEFIRMQNKQGETALHDAVRLGDKDMVDRLMGVDPELARVPPADGASPLYLAVSLGHDGIVRQLHEKDNALSYSGPNGRTALHAAVLVSEETTKMLLEWNKDLMKQAERYTGSTALHLAASWERAAGPIISLLLAADPSLAYQPDSNGSFPIHVAALTDNLEAAETLFRSGAELRDANGRTFLHVAIVEKSWSVINGACNWLRSPKRPDRQYFESFVFPKLRQKRPISLKKELNFASLIVNMQDNDGNTALHLAVQVGSQLIFLELVSSWLVKLNLTNNKGQTPLDLSWGMLDSSSHERVRIHDLLQDAGATCGARRDFVDKKRRLNEEEEAQQISEATQPIGLGSALIATVAFAAAFTLPGGYRADDHVNGGTPTLAGHYAFDVFIIADALAFILSILSIAFLISAGVVPMKLLPRLTALNIAKGLMASSARSLCAAFAFGLYVELAPVARTTAIASCVITALALLDAVWSVMMILPSEWSLAMRRAGVVSRRLAGAILMELLLQFWPYIVIASLCFRIKRVH